MKKIVAVLMVAFIVLLVWKLGFFTAFLLCAAAFFLVMLVALFVYSIHYKKQSENDIWEDEP